MKFYITYDKTTNRPIFSSTEKGFNPIFNRGCIEVESDSHPSLRGKIVVDGALVDDPNSPASALFAEAVRARLADTDWLVTRHRDQQDLQVPTSLTEDQYMGLLAYRQRLRDWTPDSGVPLPERPGFL